MTTKRPAERGFLTTGDGTRLYHETAAPGAPRGAVLLLHGFAEHCGRYDDLALRLVDLGLRVDRIDFRGHGRSGGRRGHVYAFGEYLDDAATARARLEAETPGLPRFLLGHSNGGLVALTSAATRPEGLTGLCLSSPFLGFGFEVPSLKAGAARMLSRYLPALALPTGLDEKDLSHDRAVVERYRQDPLVLRKASSRWYTETVAAQARIPELAATLRLPVLMQHGGDDRIASPKASRAAFERVGSADKTWHEYSGLYHEIWFETERERTVGDLTTWLEGHLGGA